MPRRKKSFHAYYNIDASFNPADPNIYESLNRLRDRVMRTASITLEQDSESNSAYEDFLSGFGSTGLVEFGISGAAATFYENDEREADFFNDFMQGFNSEVNLEEIPQENLKYVGHFESALDGNETTYSVAPSAALALEEFESSFTPN